MIVCAGGQCPANGPALERDPSVAIEQREFFSTPSQNVAAGFPRFLNADGSSSPVFAQLKPGGPNVLKNRGPALTAALRGQDVGPITVDIDAMRKDLRTMIEEAKSFGADLPVTASALRCYDEASDGGMGRGDITAIPVRWMKR